MDIARTCTQSNSKRRFETLCQHASVFGYRLLAILFPSTQRATQKEVLRELDEQGRLDALLCGLQYARHRTLRFGAPLADHLVIHEDSDLLVVNKPPGLLSAPGRHWTTADNLVSRLSQITRSCNTPMLVHRLDQETSGIMVLAKNRDIHKQLSQQFMERKVNKTYLACLESAPVRPSGTITLPLAAVRSGRPHQVVDQNLGKPALTQYSFLEESSLGPLVRLEPTTGRTHQLRVHCADHQGLDAPILGDELYGQASIRPTSLSSCAISQLHTSAHSRNAPSCCRRALRLIVTLSNTYHAPGAAQEI